MISRSLGGGEREEEEVRERVDWNRVDLLPPTVSTCASECQKCRHTWLCVVDGIAHECCGIIAMAHRRGGETGMRVEMSRIGEGYVKQGFIEGACMYRVVAEV